MFAVDIAADIDVHL